MNTKELYWITDQFEPSEDYVYLINEEKYANEARLREQAYQSNINA